MSDLNTQSATKLSQLLAVGAVTSEDIVESCLDRVRLRDPLIGAWESIDIESARRDARRCDREPRRSMLHGIPIAVKDNFDTADQPTAYGSPIYKDHKPRSDAACVALLKAAGAVVLGKTVTSEFAAYAWGKTVNPHDPTRSAGISSMGSAAAVADFMVPLALGSQTSGSTIRPASFCGVVGFKPSFGLLNRAGMKSLAESLDTVGLFTRSVEDAALLTAILSNGTMALSHPKQPLRVGICRTPSWEAVTPPAALAFDRTINALTNNGAVTNEVQLSDIFTRLSDELITILQYEAAKAFSYEYQNRSNELSESFRTLVETGNSIPLDTYCRAKRTAADAKLKILKLFRDCDLLLSLSAEDEAYPVASPIGSRTFGRFWTLLGLPCISLPTRFSRLPIGVLAIGPYFGDRALLSHAALISGWMKS